MKVEERYQYNPEDHKQYRRDKIILDLLHLDPYYLKYKIHQNFRTNRERIASVAVPEIRRRLARASSVRLLEIGGGEGKGVLVIHNAFPNAAGFELTMTSISPFPSHEELKAKGIRVYKGVIAERLPAVWTNKFDIVCTDSILPWTDISFSIPEIRRVLASGGVWFGIEATQGYMSEGFMPGQDVKIKHALEQIMEKNGMVNTMPQYANSRIVLNRDGAFAVRYIKE